MGVCAFANVEWTHVHLFAQKEVMAWFASDQLKYKTGTVICIYTHIASLLYVHFFPYFIG